MTDRDDDEPFDLPAEEVQDELFLEVGVFVRHAHHDPAPGRGDDALDALQHAGVVGVADVRDEHADQAGTLSLAQAPGILVAVVSDLGDDPLDVFAHLRADVLAAGEDAGHGHRTDVGGLRDVLHGGRRTGSTGRSLLPSALAMTSGIQDARAGDFVAAHRGGRGDSVLPSLGNVIKSTTIEGARVPESRNDSPTTPRPALIANEPWSRPAARRGLIERAISSEGAIGGHRVRILPEPLRKTLDGVEVQAVRILFDDAASATSAGTLASWSTAPTGSPA
ncbi:hypothetical protein GCM10025867_17290 [Frondihabitans sucicola]|uniref:Uncharacterized protein n=1 Tax=Frondihabitans sucicola TaxID=1268041 RepID=A0ABM8GM46_9MICO|nr:hypothetical protein [Frondihabitans sucicola]BDZ49488.1 hypothetical protein GCM10025867_17290 [Frondihabitans sucicola]